MTPELLSLLAGLIGAIIGASASIITVVVQARIQDRRERVRQATSLAIEDYKIQLEISKRVSGNGKIPPVTLFVDYHMRLAKELEASTLTPESYGSVCAENEALFRKIEDLNKKPAPSGTTG